MLALSTARRAGGFQHRALVVAPLEKPALTARRGDHSDNRQPYAGAEAPGVEPQPLRRFQETARQKAKRALAMTEQRDEKAAIVRGLFNRCPNCGKGKILRGYLGVIPECESCGVEFKRFPAADGPAFFTMTIMLLLLIPLLGYTWVVFRPSPLMLLVTVGGITAIITMVLLRFIKSAFIAYLWVHNEQDRGS